MLFGLQGFTLLHIAISLAAIAAGFVMVGGFLTNNRLANQAFLLLTVATNVTAFFFPFSKLLPSHIVAIISLVVLAVAIYAYYGQNLSGSWRRIYIGSALLALYLNVFVLVVQTFAKNPALAALAPTQSEGPFVLMQALTLLAFVTIGFHSIKRATQP